MSRISSGYSELYTTSIPFALSPSTMNFLFSSANGCCAVVIATVFTLSDFNSNGSCLPCSSGNADVGNQI